MTKYHINKHGVPAPCHAKDGNCPLGGISGSENHFDNLADAEKAADEINEGKFGILGSFEPKEQLNIDIDFNDFDTDTQEGKDALITDVGYLVTRAMMQKNNINTYGIDEERGDGNLSWDQYEGNVMAWYEDVVYQSEDSLSDNETIRDRQMEVFSQAMNLMHYIKVESENSDSGEEIIANTEKALNEDFKDSNFTVRQREREIEKHGDSVYPEHVDAAAGFLEFAMTDEKAYRYLDPEVHPADEQEYLNRYAKVTGTPREDLDHWTTQKALDVARNYYTSALSTSFTGDERRAEEAARELRDWVGYDFK